MFPDLAPEKETIADLREENRDLRNKLQALRTRLEYLVEDIDSVLNKQPELQAAPH